MLEKERLTPSFQQPYYKGKISFSVGQNIIFPTCIHLRDGSGKFRHFLPFRRILFDCPPNSLSQLGLGVVNIRSLEQQSSATFLVFN